MKMGKISFHKQWHKKPNCCAWTISQDRGHFQFSNSSSISVGFKHHENKKVCFFFTHLSHPFHNSICWCSEFQITLYVKYLKKKKKKMDSRMCEFGSQDYFQFIGKSITNITLLWQWNVLDPSCNID
jgi:hypothetical protein